MKRAILLGVLGSLPATAMAQNTNIVGTWSVVSLVQDSTPEHPFGEQPNGEVIWTQEGAVFVFIASRDRGKSTALASQPVGPSVAYYGTYSLDGNNLTNHVKGSTYPNFESTDQKGTITVSGDHAKLVRTITGGSQPYTVTLELTRVK
jgi:Lipocalin-like domain